MTGKKRALKSDLAKVDGHVVQLEEYEEIPELGEDWFDRADRYEGERLVRRGRGRPKSASPKKQVTMRLDADVIDGLRATGQGWQVRVNDVLRKWLQRESA